MFIMDIDRITGSILLPLAMLLLLAASPVTAQQSQTERGQQQQSMVDNVLSRLDADLDLSVAQKSRIRSILVRHATEVQARRSEFAEAARTQRARVARNEMKKELHSMKVRTQQAIRQVLTPEQRSIYEKKIEAWESERRRHHGPQRSGSSR